VTLQVVFLHSAECDLKELRAYILKRFGSHVWQESYGQIKDSVAALSQFPESGSIPDELDNLGLVQYRQVIAGMNRIIYETRDNINYIHIVCDTRRDLRSLLMSRLLRISNSF
jgi:plasmid stabilization system protein ParE